MLDKEGTFLQTRQKPRVKSQISSQNRSTTAETHQLMITFIIILLFICHWSNLVYSWQKVVKTSNWITAIAQSDVFLFSSKPKILHLKWYQKHLHISVCVKQHVLPLLHFNNKWLILNVWVKIKLMCLVYRKLRSISVKPAESYYFQVTLNQVNI